MTPEERRKFQADRGLNDRGVVLEECVPALTDIATRIDRCGLPSEAQALICADVAAIVLTHLALKMTEREVAAGRPPPSRDIKKTLAIMLRAAGDVAVRRAIKLEETEHAD